MWRACFMDGVGYFGLGYTGDLRTLFQSVVFFSTLSSCPTAQSVPVSHRRQHTIIQYYGSLCPRPVIFAYSLSSCTTAHLSKTPHSELPHVECRVWSLGGIAGVWGGIGDWVWVSLGDRLELCCECCAVLCLVALWSCDLCAGGDACMLGECVNV